MTNLLPLSNSTCQRGRRGHGNFELSSSFYNDQKITNQQEKQTLLINKPKGQPCHQFGQRSIAVVGDSITPETTMDTLDKRKHQTYNIILQPQIHLFRLSRLPTLVSIPQTPIQPVFHSFHFHSFIREFSKLIKRVPFAR